MKASKSLTTTVILLIFINVLNAQNFKGIWENSKNDNFLVKNLKISNSKESIDFLFVHDSITIMKHNIKLKKVNRIFRQPKYLAKTTIGNKSLEIQLELQNDKKIKVSTTVYEFDEKTKKLIEFLKNGCWGTIKGKVRSYNSEGYYNYLNNIRLNLIDENEVVSTVLTDVHGNFELSAPHGEYLLIVSGDYIPNSIYDVVLSCGTDLKRIDAYNMEMSDYTPPPPSPRPDCIVDVKLRILEYQTQNGIEGVTVSLRNNRQTTNNIGIVDYQGVPIYDESTTENVSLLVMKRGYNLRNETGFTSITCSSNNFEQNLFMEKDLTYTECPEYNRGVVLDNSGNPVSGATVYFNIADFYYYSDITNSNGEYELKFPKDYPTVLLKIGHPNYVNYNRNTSLWESRVIDYYSDFRDNTVCDYHNQLIPVYNGGTITLSRN